ncbi:hypothetical protein BH11PLA2_BH11PLA2_12200 [soil metagenome]
MASLRRKYYTRPIPPNAVRVTHNKKPAVRFTGRNGKPVVAPLTADGNRCRIRSDSWVGRYVDANGKISEVSLSTDRAASEMMLNELLKKVRDTKAGIIDHYTDHRKRPLTEHLAAYRRHHAELGNTAEQAELVTRRCEAVFEGCNYLRLQDLAAESAAGWLSKRRLDTDEQRGIGPQTFNHYITALKAFGNWTVNTRRLPENPFRFMAKVNADVDIRHGRRALDADEFARLITATKDARVYACLSGPDRAALYFTAAATGLRASELASLTLTSFAFDANPPTVTVAAAYSKHRREDVVPLHAELVAYLTPWLAGRTANASLWPGKWAKNKEAGQCIRRDLDAARSKWIDEASNDRDRKDRAESDFLTYRDSAGRVADFHSLRHRFITELVKAGVHPKDAKELARHSTITLTMDRYAHVGLRDTAAALAKVSMGTVKIQSEIPVRLRATGTDGAANLPPNLPPAMGEGRGLLRVYDNTDEPRTIDVGLGEVQESNAFQGDSVSEG